MPARAEAQAELVGAFTWRIEADWFGGLSGLEFNADGTEMLAVGDRGFVIRATVKREAGAISEIIADAPIRLRKGGNKPLTGRSQDAEGIAIAPDGSVYVSFEMTKLIGRYTAFGQKARILPPLREFRRLHPNRSLEAVAVDGRGHVYTLPEEPARANGQLPVYKWDTVRWSVPFTLPRLGLFSPVGADFGPDGRFYLLERAATSLGFQSRVRSWDLSQGHPQDARTELVSRFRAHGNLEGLTVWRDAEGHLRLTMIADDNFLFLLRTELVEYRLPLDPARERR